MKRAFVLLLLAILLLTGCAKQAELVVNPDAHTISDGSYTYEYTDTIDGDTRTIVIIYPNGGKYTWKQQESSAVGLHSGPDKHSYTSGSELVKAIVDPNYQPEEKTFTWLNVVLIAVGVLLVAGGLWPICRPDKVWNIFYKWFYEEDASYYALTRIVSCGIGTVAGGIMIILLGIFMGK